MITKKQYEKIFNNLTFLLENMFFVRGESGVSIDHLPETFNYIISKCANPSKPLFFLKSGSRLQAGKPSVIDNLLFDLVSIRDACRDRINNIVEDGETYTIFTYTEKLLSSGHDISDYESLDHFRRVHMPVENNLLIINSFILVYIHSWGVKVYREKMEQIAKVIYDDFDVDEHVQNLFKKWSKDYPR